MQDKNLNHDELMKNNYEFKMLAETHASIEKRLEEINKHIYLSDTEELERKKLQKEKLVCKDKMESMLSNHRDN